MTAAPLVEHFFRHEYGRVVATLVRRFGTSRLELVEDCVQSAMALAMTSWSLRGVPDNPGAWLTQTARNALVDHLRREKVASRVHDAQRPAEEEVVQAVAPALAEEISDPELRMLFVVSDPELPRAQQLVLALKILCGFSVREISLRLFAGEESVRKRLQRGRKALAELSPSFDGPSPESFATRLPEVHRILYLLFNEGYSSSKEHQQLRLELCGEALRLCRLLLQHPQGATGSTHALLALMSMHHARRDARHDDDGALLVLAEQDRSRWHWREIAAGLGHLRRAGMQTTTRYHVEAAILMEHCTAETFEATNWVDIVRLYDVLLRLNPSPMHRLNRAIAIAEASPEAPAPFATGPQAALADLRAQTPPAWLARHYLWDATLGELERRVGNLDLAEKHLSAALANAPTMAEKQRLRKRLQSLES